MDSQDSLGGIQEPETPADGVALATEPNGPEEAGEPTGGVEPIIEDYSTNIPERTGNSEVQGYNPYTFNKEMTQLDELDRLLTEVKETLNGVSMRSLLLNMEVVTQFDPGVTKELDKAKLECERCAARIKAIGTEQSQTEQ